MIAVQGRSRHSPLVIDYVPVAVVYRRDYAKVYEVSWYHLTDREGRGNREPDGRRVSDWGDCGCR